MLPSALIALAVLVAGAPSLAAVPAVAANTSLPVWQSPMTHRADRSADGGLDIDPAPAPLKLQVPVGFVMPITPNKDNLPFLLPHITPKFDKLDHLNSGLSMVLLLRHSDSPVGPHDELQILPGSFMPRLRASDAGIPPNGARSTELMADRRITRIFVSTERTLRTGCNKWGIRRELADFEWTESTSLLHVTTHVVVRDRLTQTVILDASFKSLRASVPASIDLLGKLVPALVERRIDVEGNPLGNDEWLRTRIGGGAWTTLAWTDSAKGLPADTKDRFFPQLTDLGIDFVARVKGTLEFGTPELLTPAEPKL
ncbi:hypothetical protein HK105_209340 [Polyrhizophydium stewartii]|uniref:Uncharacterized protein n=1 Tax=Polyrhizophydium stewartii TaxID=2732419 RepID=A0ABR4MVA4_9FUNG